MRQVSSDRLCIYFRSMCLHNQLSSRNSSSRFSRIIPPPKPRPSVAMACPTRQTATSIISSSRCLRFKIARPRLLVPTQRRCLHQEPGPQTAPGAATTRLYRPIRTVAPFPVRVQKPFIVNEDPEKLDAMYQKLLGGNLGLSDEVKWQAITHKSFDHGWHPFNEKLGFFGECIEG